MKVGIITLYNNNNNYGGIAQAYALQKYVSSLGHECKVINYKRKSKTIFSAPMAKRSMLRKIGDRLYREVEKKGTRRIQKEISKRNKAMAKFRAEMIPHTVEYVDEEVSGCSNDFDIFVSGSDQIWKPHVIRGPFVLDFVSAEKRKIAYGSSISQERLTDEYGLFMQKHLGSYAEIAVREKEASNYLSELLNREVQWVVDPVLLLEREEWDDLAAEKRYNKKYVFCYFLGDSELERSAAKGYAKKHGLTIVTMPYLQGKWRAVDYHFGDELIYDAGLEDFLSLIKHAECILTDSFHAVAFSYIFQKEFFVFPRIDRGSNENMNSRVLSILELIGEPRRLIQKQDDMNQNTIEFNKKELSKIEEKRKISREWLKSALENGKGEKDIL